MSNSKRVLVTAEPFAFGPASKMVSVAKRLTSHGVSVTVVARGTAYELASANELDVHLYHRNAKAVRTLMNQADLCFNVMNFELCEDLDAVGLPSVFLDTLFWFWRDKRWATAKPKLYFVQWFPGVDSAVMATPEEFRSCLQVVGPVLSNWDRAPSNSGQQVLVNFGGLESDYIKVGKDSLYPLIVSQVVLPLIERYFQMPVKIAAGYSTIKLISDITVNNSKIQAKLFSHDEFQKELHLSRCIVTTPGLETPYEAFVAGVPTLFLPPFAPTQYYQLMAFQREGLKKQCLGSPDMHSLPRNHAEEIAVVQQVVDAYIRSNEFGHSASEVLERFSNPEVMRLAVTQQDKFIEKAGRNGLDTVVNGILSLLSVSQDHEAREL